jgi:hypothetical protein
LTLALVRGFFFFASEGGMYHAYAYLHHDPQITKHVLLRQYIQGIPLSPSNHPEISPPPDHYVV